jgi:hypothetical protein
MNPKIETTRMSAAASLQHILQPFLKLPFARLSRDRLGKQSERFFALRWSNRRSNQETGTFRTVE